MRLALLRSRTALSLLLAFAASVPLALVAAPSASASDPAPFGAIDAVVQNPGSITAVGWTIDYSAPARPVYVRLYVDGHWKASALAASPRPDLQKQRPGAGLDHGFSLTGSVAEGDHTVCVRAMNVHATSDSHPERQLACQKVTVSYSPYGNIVSLSQAPGGFSLSGWAVDPDTSAPVTVDIKADGQTVGTVAAGKDSYWLPSHGFGGTFHLPGSAAAPGTHTICVAARNASTAGKDRSITCKNLALNFNPTAGIVSAVQTGPKVVVTGWAMDPDTSGPINAQITVDGKPVATVAARSGGGVHPGHMLSSAITVDNGSHTVCVVGLNTLYGSGSSAPSCKTVSVNMSPTGAFETVRRTSDGTGIIVTGWAIDPDATSPVPVSVSVDGSTAGSGVADRTRTDIGRKYPWAGSQHGYSVTVPADGNEHDVCVTALNSGYGTATALLGCRQVSAANPDPPAAPRSVTATADYTTATVRWSAPADDGGAPLTSYVVTATPSAKSVTVGPTTTSATFTGLSQNTGYTFTVVATNSAGRSDPATSAAVKTKTGPAAQTTPAPVSTSRYVRNIYNTGSATDQAKMRKEGYADAQANPTGHSYLMLLDIGGQSEGYKGVVLSAGIRFVSYANLVTDVKAYVDGYASGQRSGAPAVIAIGTNNDMDVSYSSGASWANNVVDPVVSYANSKHYSNITVAGANDIEPGFSGSQSASKSWLSGYLASSSAPFVFNGSADGCSWSSTGTGCNNGWSMSGLYNLTAGAAPSRILNLPQIYNATMAAQWRYISLTGVRSGSPRIRFGGALTEWTACQQAGSCGSITGNYAWTTLWNQLNAEPSLRISSLPYSTDLRIDS